jgi:hypothetical protein
MKTLTTAAFCVLMTCGTLSAQQSREKPPEIEVLGQYVGDWTSDVTSKPAVWTPRERKFRTSNNAEFVLGGWFLQHIEVSHEVGAGNKIGKSLFLWTFDPKLKKYVGWTFQSSGNIAKAIGTWDAATKTLTNVNLEVPPNTTSQFTQTFPNDSTINGTLVFTDHDGRTLFDMVWTRKRQERPTQPLNEEWANIGTPYNPIPAEMKRLEPFVGEWDAEFINRPSIVSPRGNKSKGLMTARWILDGRFLFGTTEVGNHSSVWVIGYDTNKKAYRYIRFTDTGLIDESTGQWDEGTRSLVWKAEHTPPGITRTSTTRFIGRDGTSNHILAKNHRRLASSGGTARPTTYLRRIDRERFTWT